MVHQELTFEFDQVRKRQQPFIPADLQLMLDLEELIELHYKKYRDQEFYAERLSTTIWVLNSLCKIYYNKTVYGLIMDRLLREAMFLLRDTSMSVRHIAFELDFSEGPCFCRFFKRMTGLTPLQYRFTKGRLLFRKALRTMT